MAKNTMSIEEKMARLQVYKDVLDHIENQISWTEREMNDYHERLEKDEETGEITDNYDFKQYLEKKRTVEAYRQLQEDLLAEA